MVSSPGSGGSGEPKINREGFVEDFRVETSQIFRREKSIPSKEHRDTINSLLKDKISNEQVSVKSRNECFHPSLCNKLFKR